MPVTLTKQTLSIALNQLPGTIIPTGTRGRIRSLKPHDPEWNNIYGTLISVAQEKLAKIDQKLADQPAWMSILYGKTPTTNAFECTRNGQRNARSSLASILEQDTRAHNMTTDIVSVAEDAPTHQRKKLREYATQLAGRKNKQKHNALAYVTHVATLRAHVRGYHRA